MRSDKMIPAIFSHPLRSPVPKIIAGIIIYFMFIALPYFNQAIGKSGVTVSLVYGARKMEQRPCINGRIDIDPQRRIRTIKWPQYIRSSGGVTNIFLAVPTDFSKYTYTKCHHAGMLNKSSSLHTTVFKMKNIFYCFSWYRQSVSWGRRERNN